MYERILLAVDGSDFSRRAGEAALTLAAAMRAELVVCHVYGARMHKQRFEDMEPGLPAKYGPSIGSLRAAHDPLIHEGLEALSVGYGEKCVATAREMGVAVRLVTAEGRNYVRILELADEQRAGLLVLGAHGLGASGGRAGGQPAKTNGLLLGSTAAKVLQHARCDVLIVRRSWPRAEEAAGASPTPDAGPIVVGIDGSDEALSASAAAADVARCLGRRLAVAAVYDPEFHTNVFRAMGRSLTPERQREVGLAEQEQLHDELINDGLRTLYQGFLDRARQSLGNGAMRIDTDLLTGRVHHALVGRAAACDAALLAVGRFGHHREAISQVGSNAEAIAHLCATDVLVTAPPAAERSAAAPGAETAEHDPSAAPVEWDDDALARL